MPTLCFATNELSAVAGATWRHFGHLLLYLHVHYHCRCVFRQLFAYIRAYGTVAITSWMVLGLISSCTNQNKSTALKNDVTTTKVQVRKWQKVYY